MFGRTAPDEVRHRYNEIVKPGVQLAQTTVRPIDLVNKRSIGSAVL